MGRRTLVADKVGIMVGGEERIVDIYVNEEGNLELEGIGHVMYDMLEEELEFTPIDTERRSNVK